MKKILKRFYESLVLLHSVGPVQDEHLDGADSTLSEVSDVETKELCREFQTQLCLICDYTKGGDTVTALLVEARQDEVVYWVASNEDPEKEIRPFLEDLLEQIAGHNAQDNREALEAELFEKIVRFVYPKLKKYWSLLQKALITVLSEIHRDNVEDVRFRKWLEEFRKPITTFDNRTELCMRAFAERKSPFMTELSERDRHIAASGGPHEDSKYSEFAEVRHYIGRLGCYTRAARILVNSKLRLPELYDSFSVQACRSSEPIPSPSASRVTLDGIAGRMFRQHQEREKRAFLEAAEFWDENFRLMQKIISKYKDPNFQPRVHAELILLEHAYSSNLTFFREDKFIACSKPACFCCYHYIYNHPGNFVQPRSHNKIYLNWRNPDPYDPNDLRAEKRQLDVMNRLIERVRANAISEVLSRRRRPWRPDSTTGITESSRAVMQNRQTDPGFRNRRSFQPVNDLNGDASSSVQGEERSRSSSQSSFRDLSDGGDDHPTNSGPRDVLATDELSDSEDGGVRLDL